MKNYIFLFLLAPVLGLTQSTGESNSPEDCVTSFFNAFHTQDTVLMKSFIHDDIKLATVKSSVDDTLLLVDDIHEFYLSIASIPDTINFLEEIISIEVETDGLIAQVWTEYTFFINNEVSHKGVNAFTLLKAGSSWKIIYLVDTRRKRD